MCVACLCGCAGVAAVVAVVDVDEVVDVEEVVVAAGGAAALCVEVDEDEPQALTMSISRMAAIGMRRCLMVVSRPPKCVACSQRTPPAAGCFPTADFGSEQPVNGAPAGPK